MSFTWASDTEPSMPAPMEPDMPVLVDLGGFGFTAGGVAHNLSKADADFLVHPFFAPEGTLPS